MAAEIIRADAPYAIVATMANKPKKFSQCVTVKIVNGFAAYYIDAEDEQLSWPVLKQTQGQVLTYEEVARVTLELKVEFVMGRKFNSSVSHAQALVQEIDKKLKLNHPVSIHYSESVLVAFQAFVEAHPRLLNYKWKNPYSEKEERFPRSSSEFTIQHLIQLSIIESANVTGLVHELPYAGLFTKAEVAFLRVLMKDVVVAGQVKAYRHGKRPNQGQSNRYAKLRDVYFASQAGFQAQSNIGNSLRLFCYPKSSTAIQDDFSSEQLNLAYYALYRKVRPPVCSTGSFTVAQDGIDLPHQQAAKWNYYNQQYSKEQNNVDLDLHLFADGIQQEFLDALDSIVHQTSNLGTDKKIHFKFLAAGTGCFIGSMDKATQSNIKLARLIGILHALECIHALPNQERQARLGKIKFIGLPFSEMEERGLGAFGTSLQRQVYLAKNAAVIEKIKKAVESLGLQFSGAGAEDAFKKINEDDENEVIGVNTCGDPHAGPSNEGGFPSTEAMLFNNTLGGERLIVYANPSMKPVPRKNPAGVLPLKDIADRHDIWLPMFFRELLITVNSMSINRHGIVLRTQPQPFVVLDRCDEDNLPTVTASVRSEEGGVASSEIKYSMLTNQLIFLDNSRNKAVRIVDLIADQLKIMEGVYSSFTKAFRQECFLYQLGRAVNLAVGGNELAAHLSPLLAEGVTFSKSGKGVVFLSLDGGRLTIQTNKSNDRGFSLIFSNEVVNVVPLTKGGHAGDDDVLLGFYKQSKPVESEEKSKILQRASRFIFIGQVEAPLASVANNSMAHFRQPAASNGAGARARARDGITPVSTQ